MSELSEWLIDIEGRRYDLRLKADRDRFTRIETACSVSTQIRALRVMRGWTQRELAERAGMRQERISALEAAPLPGCSVATLLRLAKAFEVGLTARFEPWSTVAGAAPGRR